MNILWCVRWSFRVKSPQKINKIKKNKKTRRPWFVSFPSTNPFLFCLQFRQHGNVSMIKMWSLHCITTEWRLRESNDLEYCYSNLNKKLKNYVLNLVNFSKFEGIPSWSWLLCFGAWFQLFGLFWMVTGFLIFRPLPVLMKFGCNWPSGFWGEDCYVNFP